MSSAVVGIMLVALVGAIAAVVDAARFPEWAFDQAGGEPKSTWLAGPILGGLCCGVFGVGVVVYWFVSKRAKVVAALQAGNEPTQRWM